MEKRTLKVSLVQERKVNRTKMNRAKNPHIMVSYQTHLEFCETLSVTTESYENQSVCFHSSVPRIGNLKSRGILQDRSLVLDEHQKKAAGFAKKKKKKVVIDELDRGSFHRVVGTEGKFPWAKSQ